MRSTIRFSQAAVLLLLAGAVSLAPRSAAAATADFDNLLLAPESNWHGPGDNAYNAIDQFGSIVRVDGFGSGGIGFGNRYNELYESWDGFAYSNETNNTTLNYLNQYTAITGSGAGPGADNYAVAYGYIDGLNPNDPDQLKHLPHLVLPAGATLGTALITNTTYAALTMEQGYLGAKKFGGETGTDEDWLKLTIYGQTPAGATMGTHIDFYLADFRSANPLDDFILKQWTTIDLSPLSGAKALYFNISGSDMGEYGLNTPSYFALDNIQFVPEPGTWVLATLGALGLMATVRRRVARR